MEDQQLVDRMEAVWKSIDELCSTITDDHWKRQTACPGWSVQDNLSHLIGTESSVLLGRPRPDHTPANTRHVKNPIGEANEVEVDFRRSRTGAEVLEEFREVTKERMSVLRSSTEQDFDKESLTPTGPGTVRSFLELRIFDAWVHEQDMRRALGRPGHLEGPVAEHALGRIRQALGFVVGKKASAPQGSTVVFRIEGPTAATIPIAVEGRATELAESPPDPTVTLTMDLETLNALGCGRWEAAQARQMVRIEGDAELGKRILESMNFMV